MPSFHLNLVTYTLPAFWAPYLINGDYSGMREDEVAEVDHFLEVMHPELGECVDCTTAPEFARFHDAPNTGACDCLEYTFPVKEG